MLPDQENQGPEGCMVCMVCDLICDNGSAVNSLLLWHCRAAFDYCHGELEVRLSDYFLVRTAYFFSLSPSLSILIAIFQL